MDNPKIFIKETRKIGKGLFAIEDIKKDEVIADWTCGKIYEAESSSKLPTQKIADHVLQCDEHKWIYSKGIGTYFNHSCEPNCGIKGRFQIIAMRDIKKGEELTFDYEMTEDSDWKMECKCGNSNCRKIIGAFRNMPKETREKYKGYISNWLVKKYSIKD